jgi:transcriptional regulator with XRE-family HTH domain
VETLGSRLRKARDNKHLKQTDVAKMLEVEGGTISGYERNYRDPDTATLARLAKIYGVSTDYLTTGKENNDFTGEDDEKELIIKETNEIMREYGTIEQARAMLELAKSTFKRSEK